MIFTTNKRLIKTNQTPLQYVESPIMSFSSKYRNYANQRRTALEYNSDKGSVTVTPAVVDPQKKPMKWGEPTWFMFHTLAEKVKPEYFQEIRMDMLNMILTICSNLPCPDCARHATSHLNSINFNAIRTKDELRAMLHNFHNLVNKRKGFPEFPFDQLAPKYSVANTVNIIHYFMPFFEDKHASIRMIADDMHRSRIALQLKAWFNKNIGCFDL
jgi:hypothetical protein